MPPIILQSRQDFETFWSHLDALNVGENWYVLTRIPYLLSTVDDALDFRNVAATIQKITSFSKYTLSFRYGRFYRILVSSANDVDTYDHLVSDNDVEYFLNPSQELRPGPAGERYAPDVAASEFKMLLASITSFGYLEVQLREEAWMLEDGDESSDTTIEIEYEQSSRNKAARLQLDKIVHEDLLNLPSWAKAVLGCLENHGVQNDPTETFSYASIIQSSEGLSELRKLEFNDCEMSWEMWEILFRITSIQKHLEQLTVDIFNGENQIVNLSGIGRCKALKGVTLLESSRAEPPSWLGSTDAFGLRECCNLASLTIGSLNLEEHNFFDFLPHFLGKSACPIKSSLQCFVCNSIVDESGWELFASCLQDFEDLQEVDLSRNFSLTNASVDSLIKEVFNSDKIHRFLLPAKYEQRIDEKLKHHLNMNKAGRRIVYRSPELFPTLAPTILEYASKKYPLTGVFSLLRNDLDLAKVFGSVKKRKRKIPSKFH